MSTELSFASVDVTLPRAIDNFDVIKAELSAKLDYYTTLVVTPDSIRAAEKDRAALRKLREAIDQKRKEAKKQALALYEELELQCKTLTDMIDRPIAAIDQQVKAFAEAEKQKKYDELKAHFEAIGGPSFLRLEDVLDPKWGNKTMGLSALKQGISEGVDRVEREYSEISALYKDSPLLTAIQNKYVTTLEKDTALAYAAILTKEQERREKASQTVTKEQERREKASQTVTKEVEQLPPEAKVTEPIPQQQGEPLITGCFRVTGTKAQIVALRDFMRSNNIEYTVVK
ncbi:MAG: DUF1351 domain-containing protein [Ruminococcus sp.]|nr:DUF1351 domain-containing protein [Ruminococcus sp.]